MTENDQNKQPMISVKDLWKAYGKHQVLKGLNLEVFEGETVVILGRSGVGKSVLLRQIIGIESPDKGSISISGQPITNMSRKEKMEARKSIGMLFQGSALFDSMNIGENIAFYLRQHENKLKEEVVSNRVKEALEMVGLEGIQKKDAL